MNVSLLQTRPSERVRIWHVLRAAYISAFLLLVVPIDVARAYVSEKNVFFERMSTQDGLSQNSVTTVFQDSRGFIWIGTQEGLNRFDGYRFKIFYHNMDAPGSLSNDWIWDIIEDRNGTLWIATDGGLNKFNIASETFEEITSGSNDNSDMPDGHIRALCEDRFGTLWIGTGAGLSRLDPDGTLTHYLHDANDPHSIGAGIVHSITEDDDGVIWIGTQEGGIRTFDRTEGNFSKFETRSDSDANLDKEYVRVLFSDHDGQIWIGTAEDGLIILDTRSGSIKRFRHNNGDDRSPSSNKINAILADQQGAIWVGTSQGLDLWVPEIDGFKRFEIEFSDKDSITTKDVYDLFQDVGGVVWAATNDGVSRWNSDIQYFPHFKKRATNKETLSNDSVWSFSEDEDGIVWIGTFGGLNRWNRSTGKFSAIHQGEHGLSGNRVMSMLHDSRDRFWVGTLQNGLNLLLPNKKDFLSFRANASNATSISGNAITRIIEDSKGRIWISVFGGGLNRWNEAGGFVHYPQTTDEGYRFSDLRIVNILELETGRLWLATDGGGVIEFDPDTLKTRAIRHNSTDPYSLSSDETGMLLQTGEFVWVGTRNEGLNRVDLKTGRVDRYNKQNGLASNVVYGILQDKTGSLWVSGGQGLSVLNPSTGEVHVYDSTHGLQNDDFNHAAAYVLRDGMFLFGGNNGFNIFDPMQVHGNAYVPPVRLTRFTKFNKDVLLPQPVFELDSIDLNHDDYVIGFEFAAMDFTAPSKNRYRYMLEGFDRDWVEIQGIHQATYTNLPSGNYVFRVQGSNNDGVWNTEGLAINVKMNPPIWLTWWAYMLYTLVACGLFYQIWQAQKERVKREAEKRYNARLQLYIESLEEASDCVLIADADQKLMYANQAVREVMGIDPDLAKDRSLMDLIFSSGKDATRAKTGLAARGRWHGEVQNWRNDQEYTAEVTLASVKDPEETTVAFVSIARDVTDRKRTERELDNYRRNLEQRVEERTEALSREIVEHKAARRDLANSLKEKELLLKEVHHRVKNNMQIISSLLNIQAESIGDPTFTTLLGESQQRIKSMALIHENLYQSESLLEIGFQDYIHSLAGSLCRLYVIPGVQIVLDVDVDDISLDIDTAVPCGLIINELITNALKHAFTDHTGEGRISVHFKRWDNGYVLTISDDGRGMPVNFDVLKSQTMGMEIVCILTEQLEGEIEFIREGGSTFRIRFPHHEITTKTKRPA